MDALFGNCGEHGSLAGGGYGVIPGQMSDGSETYAEPIRVYNKTGNAANDVGPHGEEIKHQNTPTTNSGAGDPAGGGASYTQLNGVDEYMGPATPFYKLHNEAHGDFETYEPANRDGYTLQSAYIYTEGHLMGVWVNLPSQGTGTIWGVNLNNYSMRKGTDYTHRQDHSQYGAGYRVYVSSGVVEVDWGASDGDGGTSPTLKHVDNTPVNIGNNVANATLIADQWHFIAVYCNSSYHRLYVDGEYIMCRNDGNNHTQFTDGDITHPSFPQAGWGGSVEDTQGTCAPADDHDYSPNLYNVSVQGLDYIEIGRSARWQAGRDDPDEDPNDGTASLAADPDWDYCPANMKVGKIIIYDGGNAESFNGSGTRVGSGAHPGHPQGYPITRKPLDAATSRGNLEGFYQSTFTAGDQWVRQLYDATNTRNDDCTRYYKNAANA